MRRLTIAPRGSASRDYSRAMRRFVLMVCANAVGAACVIAIGKLGSVAHAQTQVAPAQNAAAITTKPVANLLQIMRGVMFPESNVVFAGQNDVSKIPLAVEPALLPNLLTSVFGGWQAVENSALGLAESSDLLAVPGRTCANGIAVPVAEEAWVKYVNGMREAALEAYKAAQAKSADAMVDAAGTVSDSCMACHNVYRSNRTGMDGRCKAAPPRTPQAPAANAPAA